MGDADDERTPSGADPVTRIQSTVDGLAFLATVFPDSPLATVSAQQRPWPTDVSSAPLIIDTDIGGDPDDAVALCLAARFEPRLALVVTCDETTADQGGAGLRARAARWLLDACGRPEVPVAAGPPAGGTTQFVLDRQVEAITDAHDQQAADVGAAVRAVAADSAARRVRWLGIGPMTNLAALIRTDPVLADRLAITQMGGALAYRDPASAEHNIRVDVPAARQVLDAARTGVIDAPEFVTSDVTFTPEIAIADGDALHRRLRAADADWARAVATCLTAWFTHPRGYDASMQHDPLTLTAALGLPFVHSRRDRVALDPIGRMTRSADGAPVWLSHRADYPAFMRWLTTALEAEPDVERRLRDTGPDGPVEHLHHSPGPHQQ